MRRVLVIISLTLACVLPARAEDVASEIANQLSDYGYSSIEIRKSFLGRDVVTGEKGDIIREIVINPRNGNILRDRAFRRSGSFFNLANRNADTLGELLPEEVQATETGEPEEIEAEQDSEDEEDHPDSPDGGEVDEEDEPDEEEIH